MDAGITQFFTPGTVILSFAVVILTFFVRRTLETSFPSLRKQCDENHPKPSYLSGWARWWNQVLLYLIPVLLGVGMALWNIKYLFAIEGLEDLDARLVFGGVIGWLSSFIYKIVRMLVKQRVGVDIQPTPSTFPGVDEPLG